MLLVADDRPLLESFARLLRCNYAWTAPSLRHAFSAATGQRLNPPGRLRESEGAPLKRDIVHRHVMTLPDAPAGSAPLPGPPVATDGRIRVGFVSKYFTLNHPHAQLLTGVVRGLDRDKFHTHLLRIDNLDRGFYPCPVIEAAAETVSTARQALAATLSCTGRHDQPAHCCVCCRLYRCR